MIVQCFQKSILSRVITKSPSRLTTSQKLQLLPPFVCLNIFSHLLAYPMLLKPFKEWWIKPQIAWKVCLHTWTTLKLALRTGKHTSAIWRLFSMLWLPMVWQLIWKSVFLQPPLLKSLATRFRRREWPLWPITPPKLKIARPLRTSGGLTATKQVSFSDPHPLVSSPSSPMVPPRDGPRTVFLPGEEVFACPGPAAPSQVPQTRYPSRQRAPPKRLDLWPLLLPAEARAWGEPCGHLPTSLVGGQTSGCIPATLDSTCTVPVYKLICRGGRSSDKAIFRWSDIRIIGRFES